MCVGCEEIAERPTPRGRARSSSASGGVDQQMVLAVTYEEYLGIREHTVPEIAIHHAAADGRSTPIVYLHLLPI